VDALTAATNARFSVGLTGGIGSGKTTVANLFAAHGASVIDTDLIAHQLTAPGGAALAQITAQFGPTFLLPDGSMNRPMMRDQVFSDPHAKKKLEAILHPLIGIEVAQAACTATGPYLIYVVPLLVESGKWRDRVARILVVDCSEALQVARVMQRSALSESQIRAIMATQATREQRLAAADDVVINDADTTALIAPVERLHLDYCRLATARAAPSR
jgi:dephospho-CoA kinase